jgi:hypothetical protein
MKQDWFPFIQRTFHVALAGFRLTLQSAWYIRPFTELITLIAPILTKLQLTYYLNLISKDLVYYARHFWEHSFETIKALHELFSTVRIFFLGNIEVIANQENTGVFACYFKSTSIFQNIAKPTGL